MQRRGAFSVSVTKDYLVFSSAHFITYRRASLRGIARPQLPRGVTLDGELAEESWWVFDFVALKADHAPPVRRDRPQGSAPAREPSAPGCRARRISDGCLRGTAPLSVPAEGLRSATRFRTRRWRCWRSSSRAVSAPSWRRPGAPGLTAIEMEIEENFGQSAVYRLDLP